MDTYREFLLTTNKYKNPVEKTGANAIALLLVRLITMEPGTDTFHPAMGLGLGPKYRFINKSDLLTLQNKLEYQINTFLPSEILVGLKVYTDITSDNKLVLTAIIDGTKYVYDTSTTENPVTVSSK